MPNTLINQSGDGINDTFLECYITLPDSGSSIPVMGRLQLVGKPLLTITPTSLTAPAIPGAGVTTYWAIQVDNGTGTPSIVQSPTASPAPTTGSDGTAQTIIFTQTLTSTSGVALDGDSSATPDQPI